MTISISNGNIKMGQIPSVSLPAVKTCRSCGCEKKCYALRMERLRPTVRKAYQRNLDTLVYYPEVYWREVEAAVMMARFFRFHVSGDIVNGEYFEKMVDIAKNNPHCQILCFTKKYQIVNSYISTNGSLPENLHLIFSGWTGLQMDNPFKLPEAHVRFRDGTTTARSDAQFCGGNCSECAKTSGGCWALKSGQQVIFKEH